MTEEVSGDNTETLGEAERCSGSASGNRRDCGRRTSGNRCESDRRFEHGDEDEDDSTSSSTSSVSSSFTSSCKVWTFLLILALDLTLSVILLTNLVSGWFPETSSGYAFYASQADLFILALLRISSALLALTISFCLAEERPEYPFELWHPNGDTKTREELEQEASEEPYWPWFKRLAARPAFSSELCSILTLILCLVKSIVRLHYELRHSHETSHHPVFWIALVITAIFAQVEWSCLDRVCLLMGSLGEELAEAALRAPLLAADVEAGAPSS